MAQRERRADARTPGRRRRSTAAPCRPRASTRNGRSGSASASAARSGAVLMPPRRASSPGARAGSARRPTRGPSFSSAPITQADGSNSQRRSPCAAEVGNAWWLLCHASPKVRNESQNRLRDSSLVANRRRPKKWHSELIEYVAWCSDEHAHRAAPQQAGEAVAQRAAEQPAEEERRHQPADHAQHEAAVDRAHDRIGDQVGRVAAAAAAVGVQEQPADDARARGRAARRAGPSRDRRGGCADRPGGRRTRGACGGRRPRR